MTPIHFGTDGWRAVIAEDFTFANLERVAQAAADYWLAQAPAGCEPRVVVGYDRRFLSDGFARRVAEVLAGNGLETILTDRPTPTPAVSLAVQRLRARGGVMITASHNPARFNGFKLKGWYAGSADEVICGAVEALLDRNPVRHLPLEQAQRERRVCVRDLRPAHYRAVKRLVDFDLISRAKLRVAHDALFGVGASCFAELLGATTCQVTTINGAHDPLFGGLNPEPVPQNYGPASAFLRRHPHDVCLVTDGDADRLGGQDGRGRPLSTHQLICLLLQHVVAHRGGRGKVVKALTTTSMVDKICAASGLELVQTAVGFKYISAAMRSGGVLFGGEESGGIALPPHIPERDGILAGLLLLELLATERKPLAALLRSLEKQYGPHHYARVDGHVPLEQRAELMDFCRRQPPSRLLRQPLLEVKTFDGVKYIARDGAWLMLRCSGTEPVLRIYAEAPSAAGARQLLRLGVRLTRQVVGPHWKP